MDCRLSLVLALAFTLTSAGCQLTNPFAKTQTAQGPKGDVHEVPPPGAVIHKPVEHARAPMPGTVAAIGKLKEGDASMAKDASSKMKLLEEARVIYQESLKLDPANRDAVAGLTRVYSALGDHDQAIALLNKALEKPAEKKGFSLEKQKPATDLSRDTGLWNELAMCYNRKKDFAQACKCLQKSLELEPQSRQTMQTYGFTLARAGQVDQALAMLTRVQGAASAHYEVARMLQHLGQEQACREQLALALRENPEHERARDMLAALSGNGAPDSGAPANSGLANSEERPDLPLVGE